MKQQSLCIPLEGKKRVAIWSGLPQNTCPITEMKMDTMKTCHRKIKIIYKWVQHCGILIKYKIKLKNETADWAWYHKNCFFIRSIVNTYKNMYPSHHCQKKKKCFVSKNMTFARHKDTSRSDRKGTQTQNKAQSWGGDSLHTRLYVR